MSVRIKVSYTDREELDEIIKRLHPVRSIRQQGPKGKYSRAYVVPEMLGGAKAGGGSRPSLKGFHSDI